MVDSMYNNVHVCMYAVWHSMSSWYYSSQATDSDSTGASEQVKSCKGHKVSKKAVWYIQLYWASGKVEEKVLLVCGVDVFYQLKELITVKVFLPPHKFCQVCTMHSSVYTIVWHSHLSMVPITFHTIGACCILFIEEFLTVIYCNMHVAQWR